MDDFKEVNFKEYCEKCKYKDLKEVEDPCNECLEYGALEGTRKPYKFEEAK